MAKKVTYGEAQYKYNREMTSSGTFWAGYIMLLVGGLLLMIVGVVADETIIGLVVGIPLGILGFILFIVGLILLIVKRNKISKKEIE